MFISKRYSNYYFSFVVTEYCRPSGRIRNNTWKVNDCALMKTCIVNDYSRVNGYLES